MKCVPLHNHSEESVFDGMSSMEEIVDRVKEIGSNAVALTDHGVVSGHLAFGKACKNAGLKPIFGMEGYQAPHNVSIRHKKERDENDRKVDNFHVILLAQNDKGLKNLWTLSSLAHAKGFYRKPRMDWDMLRLYNEGIIATSACLGGLVSQEVQEDRYDSLEQYLSIFDDRFYIELHTYDTDYQARVNLALVDLARKFGLPVVYATDAHYAREDQYDLHEQMLHLAYHKNKEENDDAHERVAGIIESGAKRIHAPSLWIKDEARIRESLSYLPRSVVDEAIANSQVIADMCDVELPGFRKRVPVYIPEYNGEKFKSGEELLYHLLSEGYDKKILEDPDDIYARRLLHEFKVIKEADLVDFFLITWDICRFADEQGIVRGPGRGSAGGSLISYLLGITDIDPLRYGLIFERFYNAGRERGALPDIDIDFPTSRREEIVEYCRQKYGEDHIVGIGTKLRLHGASTVDRAYKIHPNVPVSVIKSIKKLIAGETDAGIMAKWEEIEPILAQEGYVDQYPEFFETVRGLHDRIFASGTHASGYIISDEPLYGVCPVRWNAQKGALFTQFDMKEVANLGFMKQDFLGITKLDTLEEAKKLIKQNHGVQFHYNVMHHYPADMIAKQTKAWQLLEKGLTTGIFQIEEGKMAKEIAKYMKPQSIEELAALVALNRPGPLRGGAVEAYLERKMGEEWSHMHSILEQILDETYGVFVFQEQVIQFMQLLGFSAMEADNVRRIMGKKIPEEMAAFKPEYLKRAVEFMTTDEAELIWEAIENFSKYGFNKSHAVGYALLAYWTAIAKGHYPAEFLLASMRCEPKEKDKYIAEAVRMGIPVRPPDINKSGYEADLVEGEIIFGLSNIKGVGKGAEWIIANRPFKSKAHLEEILESQTKEWMDLPKEEREQTKATRPKAYINSGKIRALWDAGAFDTLEERDLTSKERKAFETELLGTVLSYDEQQILDRHREVIEANCTPFNELDESGKYCIAGFITAINETTTRNGDKMLWLTLQDGSDTIELSAFQNVMGRYDFLLEEYKTVIAEISVNGRGKTVRELMELR